MVDAQLLPQQSRFNTKQYANDVHNVAVALRISQTENPACHGILHVRPCPRAATYVHSATRQTRLHKPRWKMLPTHVHVWSRSTSGCYLATRSGALSGSRMQKKNAWQCWRDSEPLACKTCPKQNICSDVGKRWVCTPNARTKKETSGKRCHPG